MYISSRIITFSYISDGISFSSQRRTYLNRLISEHYQILANTAHQESLFEKSTQYYLKSANYGSSEAHLWLSYVLANGKGIDKDMDRAKKYLFQDEAFKNHPMMEFYTKGLVEGLLSQVVAKGFQEKQKFFNIAHRGFERIIIGIIFFQVLLQSILKIL